MKSRESIVSSSSLVTTGRTLPMTSAVNTTSVQDQPLLVSVNFEVWGETCGQ